MTGKLKVALCVLLTALAVLSLTAVLGKIGVLDVAAAEPESDAAYLLREYGGYIGVYYPSTAERPTTVTGIRVRDLPAADRLALAEGVGAADYAAVVQLLEDYGA